MKTTKQEADYVFSKIEEFKKNIKYGSLTFTLQDGIIIGVKGEYQQRRSKADIAENIKNTCSC